MAFELDAAHSALIIQDLQNDVIGEGGAFADSGAPAHAQSQNVVENVKSLAAAARKAGMAVIHVHYIVEEGAPGLKLNAPLFQGVAEAKAMVRGTWGAAAVAGLEPQAGDLVVEKMRMNGFHDTPLETILKGLGVDTIVISGAWTNFSVEHTARHGADAGYRAVVLTDGTSTINDEWHNAGLNYCGPPLSGTLNGAGLLPLENIADIASQLARPARRPRRRWTAGVVFYSILDHHAYAGFEFSVLKSTFETNKSVYNVEHQSSPFGFCLHGIVNRLVKDEGVKDVLALPNVSLSFVVESGNSNEGDIRRRFNSIQKQDPERFASIRFEPKKEKIALQAADFLAYYCRRLRTKDPEGKSYKKELEFFEIAKKRMKHRLFLATDFGI